MASTIQAENAAALDFRGGHFIGYPNDVRTRLAKVWDACWFVSVEESVGLVEQPLIDQYIATERSIWVQKPQETVPSNFGWLAKAYAEKDTKTSLELLKELSGDRVHQKMKFGSAAQKIVNKVLQTFYRSCGYKFSVPESNSWSELLDCEYSPDFESELHGKVTTGEIKTLASCWMTPLGVEATPRERLEAVLVAAQILHAGDEPGHYFLNEAHPYVLQSILYAIAKGNFEHDIAFSSTEGVLVFRGCFEKHFRMKLVARFWAVRVETHQAVPEPMIARNACMSLINHLRKNPDWKIRQQVEGKEQETTQMMDESK